MCFVSKRWRKLTLIRCLTWCLRFLQGISMNLRFSFSRIICCTMLHDVARCTYCAFFWEKQILLVALARIVADSWPWFGDISDIVCQLVCQRDPWNVFWIVLKWPHGSLWGTASWHGHIPGSWSRVQVSLLQASGERATTRWCLAALPLNHHHIITSSSPE